MRARANASLRSFGASAGKPLACEGSRRSLARRRASSVARILWRRRVRRPDAGLARYPDLKTCAPPARGHLFPPAMTRGDGAPKGASILSRSRTVSGAWRLSALHRGVFSGAGPRFQTSRICGPPSASSWRGVVVPPSGAPAPPECREVRFLAPAGTAPCSIIKTSRDDALSRAKREVIDHRTAAKL